MIYYNISINQKIIDDHYNKLKIILETRIGASTLNTRTKSFISNNLEKIIKSNGSELLKINESLGDLVVQTPIIKSKIRKIFDYTAFSRKSDNGSYDAYQLATNFNIRTCLYCNRNYTLTVCRGIKRIDKITRPEFDHFFDKADHPLLALSLYNLIPSCKTCNSVLKHTKKFNLNQYIHPFQDNVIDFYNYRFIPHDVKSILGVTSNLVVTIDVNSGNLKLDKKIKKYSETFKLAEIMSSHSEELKDLFDIKHRFSDRYFEELYKKYSSIGISLDDAYKIIFGTYYNETEFSKRPFSKLKKDILKELNII